jgi:hypothetical protein
MVMLAVALAAVALAVHALPGDGVDGGAGAAVVVVALQFHQSS